MGREFMSDHKPSQTVETIKKEVKALKKNYSIAKILFKKNNNDRLRAQKRFSWKHNVLLVKSPFSARTSKDVTQDMLKVFDIFREWFYREIT